MCVCVFVASTYLKSAAWGQDETAISAQKAA